MTDWPWHLCPACAKGSRCSQHAGGVSDETPYQTLTRWGSVSVLVRTDNVREFRDLLRQQARSDRLRIRTYQVNQHDLSMVLAELTDYKFSDEDELERMHEAMKDLNWGDMDDADEAR